MKHNGIIRLLAAVLGAGVMATVITGCTSQADTASKNVGKRCEKFECQRRIVVVNNITDKVELLVEGKCSIEGDNLGGLRALQVICKQGPGRYYKHIVGMGDNTSFVTTQLQSLAVSEFRTKIVLKPQQIVPDFDLAR